MTSGRYTAYHIYQNTDFPEAQKAGTRPYKLPEYQCQHSQRGYLFQFENMVERTHFDAANTSCCNEPVLNFANKPQYAEASKPMKPQDCGAKVEATGCTILEVFVESLDAFCADSAAKISRIKIQCPSLCPDLVAVQGGGRLQGRYGVFSSLGMEAGDVMIMDYVPDSDLISDWFDNCSGVGTLVEEFCGGYTLSYTLRAGLNSPYGCGCDCCGDNGSFSPPNMTVVTPSSINSNWSNIVTIPGNVSGDESCSGGNLTGIFTGVGSSSVEWDGEAQFHSNGYTRFITRDPGYVGSSGNSTCCGGTIHWTGTDGCGGGDAATTVVGPTIGSSTIAPASGTTQYEYGISVFSGSGACSYAAGADLTIVHSCLTNTTASLERYDGHLKRRFNGQLQFSGTRECSGCCSSGSISVSFSNGCGGNYSADYNVRRQYSGGAHMGYVYRCADYYSGIHHYYKVSRADVHCNGSSGSFTFPFGDYFVSLDDCLQRINGPSAMDISGAGGCSGSLSGSTDCCRYADNGSSGYDFRSWVFSVSGSRCCDVKTDNGAWVSSGAGAECCPLT